MNSELFYEFGAFRLEPAERRLLLRGVPQDLTPKEFDLLLALVLEHGHVLSKDELKKKVWGEKGATDDTLRVTLSGVKKVLGEVRREEHYIETVSGRGYRFKGAVRSRGPAEEGGKGTEADRVTTRFVYEEEIRETHSPEQDLHPLPAVNSSPQLPGAATGPHSADVVQSGSLLPPAAGHGLEGSAIVHVKPLLLPAGRSNQHRRRLQLVVVAAIGVAVLAGSGLYLWRRRKSEAGLEVRQLTTNPSEIPLTATAISPDGKYIAYANEEGICVQVVETGEMHVLPPPESGTIYRLSWFPDSMKLLASLQDAQDDRSTIWELSIFGGTPRKLNDGAGEAAVSPDGSRIAFVSENGEEMWLEGPDGEDAHRIFAGGEDDTFHELAWGPQGRRILFGRIQVRSFITNVSIQSIDLENGLISTIASGSGLRGMCASPDGRIIYSREDAPPNQNTVNLWQIKFNYRTGKVARAARRITSWPGSCIYSLSLTADGKCLAFLKGPYQANVYVADVKGNGTRLQNSRLLTLDDADDLPTAWTRDSKAVLFHSDRYGKWQIFEQAIGQRSAELIASDQEDDKGARVTPDGKSLLYFARPKYKIFQSAAPTRLMITPLAGGPSRLILSERGVYSVRCSRLPADLCVLGERGLTHHQLVFYALDPLHGKGNQRSTTHVDLPIDQTNWDLSSDGSQIAVALGGKPDGHIRIISLPSRQAHDLTIKGRSGFQSMDWSADGEGVYVSSRTSWGADLLYVDMQGHATVLRQLIGSYETWAVPSPDGKHLAFLEWTASGKVWMLKGF